jgi:hypothetical protein
MTTHVEHVNPAGGNRGDGLWNPRYLAYCVAQKATNPAEMMARDEIAYPGGKMAGFIIWIGQQWSAWCAETKYPEREPRGPVQHNHFDAWLAERVIRL